MYFLYRIFHCKKNRHFVIRNDDLTLSMGYKKDIFAVFAYEFEMIYLLCKHEIISVPSYAEGIHHCTTVRYHTKDISPVRAKERISLKNGAIKSPFRLYLISARKVIQIMIVILFNSRLLYIIRRVTL